MATMEELKNGMTLVDAVPEEDGTGIYDDFLKPRSAASARSVVFVGVPSQVERDVRALFGTFDLPVHFFPTTTHFAAGFSFPPCVVDLVVLDRSVSFGEGFYSPPALERDSFDDQLSVIRVASLDAPVWVLTNSPFHLGAVPSKTEASPLERVSPLVVGVEAYAASYREGVDSLLNRMGMYSRGLKDS